MKEASISLTWKLRSNVYEAKYTAANSNLTMSESNNYPVDIVERTEAILKTDYFSSTEYEVTFLVNCLSGILIAAKEFDSRKGKKLGNLFFTPPILAIIPENLTFFNRNDAINRVTLHNQSISWEVLGKTSLSTILTKPNYNIGWFLEKIRNAIAHQHIEAINTDGKWTGILLWNEPQTGVKDFMIEFSVAGLREFALHIAGLYLNIYKTESGD